MTTDVEKERKTVNLADRARKWLFDSELSERERKETVCRFVYMAGSKASEDRTHISYRKGRYGELEYTLEFESTRFFPPVERGTPLWDKVLKDMGVDPDCPLEETEVSGYIPNQTREMMEARALAKAGKDKVLVTMHQRKSKDIFRIYAATPKRIEDALQKLEEDRYGIWLLSTRPKVTLIGFNDGEVSLDLDQFNAAIASLMRIATR